MSAVTTDRTMAYLQIATGAGIAAFWALFFTVGLAPDNAPACYFAFEHAFPLPDLVLAAALLAAGRGLADGKPWGRALSLPCSGGLIFLGLVDFSFNVQNGIYAASGLDGAMSAAMNAWCVAFGTAMIGVFLAAELPGPGLRDLRVSAGKPHNEGHERNG
jgi:hypothetical protein